MNQTRFVSDHQKEDVETLAEALVGCMHGEVRFDRLTRAIYATDASIYEMTPAVVVFPRTIDDVAAIVDVCRARGVPVTARGAGTGLTGGALGDGVLIDLSRHLNRIGHLDPTARTIDVEPGVVLDELNAHLAPHGFQFAPDVATASRATIGGMIANNSCGAHSVLYGRTVDHIVALNVVTSDGRITSFHGSAASSTEDAGARLGRELASLRDRDYEEITKRFPGILRSNCGYGLDRLGSPGTPADPIKILCGSEGTLGIVVGATLRVVPLPKHRGLVLLHFERMSDALAATPAILAHKPAAIELIDRLIIHAGRSNPVLFGRCGFLKGDPAAVLIVEFFDDDAVPLTDRIDRFIACGEVPAAYTVSKVLHGAKQTDVWSLRKSGLGLLMSKPGDRQPHAFVEDTAVDPSRLRDYIERFSAILEREHVEAGIYAHASVGCLHIRPVLNLKKADDVERMHRIAHDVSNLVMEFGGTVTGEHGDGIARSTWIAKQYGPRIVQAFRDVKLLFDPDGLFNPNKIVDPGPMTEPLRLGPDFASRGVKTYLDFSAHQGMAGLAGMCSGVGACRQQLDGTMCPSYRATRDERDSTRARANALRVALSNRGVLDGLDDPALAEVMDLCVSCKACKTECPTGVDMARLKLEFLAQRHLTHGASPRDRLVADLPGLLARASRFPRLANAIGGSKILRAILDRRYGFDRRVAPPRLAHRTFRSWFRRHRKARPDPPAPRGPVVYFVDTWTNYYTPQTGIAAVQLLERLGFHVCCPETLCCGRPAISKGFLAEATESARTNIRRLERVAAASTPIVGTEPSCLLTLVDEYPQLVRSRAARNIASRAVLIETLIRRVLDENPAALGDLKPSSPVLYHTHCHQSAIVGSEDAVALMRHVWGNRAGEIDSGCCGMAGSFGHEKEHYDVARRIGEERLFPAVRARSGAVIAASGFSCRHQIEHHTGVQPRHLIEYLAEALDPVHLL